MSCYHPLKLFKVSSHKNKDGKIVQSNIVKPYDVDCIQLENGEIIRDYITIPCGKCIGCRLEYSRQWANRCLLEMENHDSSYFLTLTYDDDHLPTRYYSRIDTYETDLVSHPLEKRDVQLFMKRLRKWHEERGKLRYFLAGEYGDTTHRPHYHAIIFGLAIDDLVEYGKSKTGFTLFNSESIDKCWSKGYVVIEECTWETCAYTARYIMKKQTGLDSVFYDQHCLTPEFVLMSRKPGIGYQYFVDHPEVMNYEFINSSSCNHRFRPPSYYNRLYRLSCPEEAEVRNIRSRENADQSLLIKSSKSSQRLTDLLKSEEVNLEARTRALKRDVL